jgi:asparagine synthase (glutamine-hydrolysing)
MSAIVGLWNLTGEPADAAVLSRMGATLRHRGADGEGRRIAGSVGFVHHHLWVTPEETGEAQPLAGPGGVMLAMDGRLDNRDELLPALGLPRTSSDAACVLAAYRAWGDGFAERLNGDFAIVVFDELQRRLVLARDALGIRPLYYYRNERLCAFATEVKALLAHPGVPIRPDEEGLADYMLLGTRPLDRQDVTCFAGVSAVVASHLVIVTPGGLATRRYWDFDPGRTIRLPSFDEYADAFRERFAEAVRRRVRSVRPVAVSVSGGIDSSSVFCQAEALRRAGAASCPRLSGVSYVGAEGTDADERQYLLDIEHEYGVAIERYPIEPFVGLIEGVDDQIRTVEAPFLDYMWGVTRELNRRAAAGGARVLVSGHWGDQVFFSHAYLVDLFDRLAWGEIRRHAREYRNWFAAGEARVLVRRFPIDLVRHHLPAALVPPLKWIRRRLSRRARQKLWFSDGFLQRALRFADRPATIGAGFHSAHARSIYLEARSKYHVHCMEWHNKIDALSGLDAAFPCLDRDLLAFLMAVPGDIQNRDGVPRALLREAMKGVLPEPVRARRWKADFAGVVNRGIALDAAPLARALSPECLAARMGYLDAERLGPEVARLSASVSDDNCLGSWALADLFGLEVWLQVFLGPSREVTRPPLQ